MTTRIERDTFGPIEVPADRLWGAQTQRSLTFFKVTGIPMPTPLLRALALVKKAAALVNIDLGVLDERKGRAIAQAADEVLAGKRRGAAAMSGEPSAAAAANVSTSVLIPTDYNCLLARGTK